MASGVLCAAAHVACLLVNVCYCRLAAPSKEHSQTQEENTASKKTEASLTIGNSVPQFLESAIRIS